MVKEKTQSEMLIKERGEFSKVPQEVETALILALIVLIVIVGFAIDWLFTKWLINMGWG